MKKNKGLILILSIILGVLLLWFTVFVPLPYYIESPGGAMDVKQVLTVNEEEDKKDGSYEFT